MDSLRFNAAGLLLAVVYQNSRVYVWNLNTRGTVVKDVAGLGCEFLPDAGSLLVSGPDRTLAVWTLDPPAKARVWPVTAPLRMIRVQPHGDWIAGMAWNSSLVHIINFRTGAEVRSLTQPGQVSALAWSPDGNHLAVGCIDHRIYVWDTRTGRQQARLEGHEATVVAAAFNPAGTLMATSGWDNTFRLWDTAGWRQLLVGEGSSYNFQFDTGGRYLAHILHAGMVGTMEIATGKEFHEAQAPQDAHFERWSVDISPDGRLAATGHTDGFALWDLIQRKELAFMPCGGCRSVIFSADGTGLFTSGVNDLARWPISVTRRGDAEEVRVGSRQIIRDGLPFLYAALSRGDRWIAAANRPAACLSVYEVNRPENRFALTNQPGVQFVAFSSDLKWLASGSWQGTGVKVWNFAKRRLECELPVRGSSTVAFSPDGRWLVTGSGMYQVWDTGSWRERYQARKPDPENGIGVMTFSPDSRVLATVQEGHDIVLLEADTGREIASLESPRRVNVASLCFSRDGAALVALGFDQNLQIWDLREMRHELAGLRLDWDLPSYPPDESRDARPLAMRTATIAPFSPEDLAERIPPRAPDTPATLVDLTRWFDAPLTESWQGDANTGNDLSELPRGVRDLAGVRFDVRGVVQLNSPHLEGRFPTNVTGIRIEQRCRRLRFLHGVSWLVPEGTVIARYIVHVHSGRRYELPVRYGYEVRDWWRWPAEADAETPDARVAWKGSNPMANTQNITVRLFDMTWNNPAPESEVESVDFETTMTAAAPFLLAITAEP